MSSEGPLMDGDREFEAGTVMKGRTVGGRRLGDRDVPPTALPSSSVKQLVVVTGAAGPAPALGAKKPLSVRRGRNMASRTRRRPRCSRWPAPIRAAVTASPHGLDLDGPGWRAGEGGRQARSPSTGLPRLGFQELKVEGDRERGECGGSVAESTSPNTSRNGQAEARGNRRIKWAGFSGNLGRGPLT